MRISELLNAMASWLESPDNEALLLAEYDQGCLTVVANSCVSAANSLRVAANEVDLIEPLEDSKITPESIDGLANLASALDSSGDPELMKQASVIDELLLTIAAPPDAINSRNSAQEYRLEELKKKYHDPKKELDELNKVSDSLKAIDKSNMIKEYKILEAPLQSRTCPDHPGAQMQRVGESLFICELDKKQYDYANGYTLQNGTKVPGSSVENQTQGLSVPTHSIFDDRQGRLQSNKP